MLACIKSQLPGFIKFTISSLPGTIHEGKRSNELSYCCWKWLPASLGIHFPSSSKAQVYNHLPTTTIAREHQSSIPHPHGHPSSSHTFGWYTAPKQALILKIDKRKLPNIVYGKPSLLIHPSKASRTLSDPCPLNTAVFAGFGNRIICRTSRTPYPNAILPEKKWEKQECVRIFFAHVCTFAALTGDPQASTFISNV